MWWVANHSLLCGSVRLTKSRSNKCGAVSWLGDLRLRLTLKADVRP